MMSDVVSWHEIAMRWRPMFPEVVDGWIELIGSATCESATRFVRTLDATMQHEQHDGASSWGMFRNDVTAWLASFVRDHATPSDREHLIAIAACTERYLRALGSGHAPTTAPLAAKWREALEHADADAFHALVDEARATHEMHTAGAGGVLRLIEASGRVIEGTRGD
jgi:hypothetical protein